MACSRGLCPASCPPIKYFATSLTSVVSPCYSRCIWLDSALTHPDSYHYQRLLKTAHTSPCSLSEHTFFIFSFFISFLFPAIFALSVIFQTRNRHPLPVFTVVIPSSTRQTVWPGGSIHQLPSAVTPHLTTAMLLSGRHGNQHGRSHLAPVRRSGALCTMCLQRPGAGGLLWRVATLGEPHGLLFVWTRTPMHGCSLAVAERNEM